MKDYKKLDVWKQGIIIVKHAYELTKQLPNQEKYNLKSQINRSAVSIPSNIAEGSSRRSEKDYFRFLEISLGSCYELETQILIIKVLNLLNKEEVSTILELIEMQKKQLSAFMNVLNR